MSEISPPPARLFTKEFLALNGIAFLTFCNMAIFFQFYRYLQTLPIGPEWQGFLIALFSIIGLIIRPFISPFLHSGNARRWGDADALGIFLGLGWGIAMPVLNALMFDISPVHCRGLNTNLGVQMFQGGFFLGHLVGAYVVTHGNFRQLYYLCAILTIVAAALTTFTVIKKEGKS